MKSKRVDAARVVCSLAAGVLTVIAMVAASAPASAVPVTLIPRHSTWKYFAGPTDPGVGWQTPSFVDGSWASGPGPLGYNEIYIATVVPYGGDLNNVWTTTYFRNTFFLAQDPTAITQMKLGLNFDDGIVVYINGTEVARRSMPAGPVSWGTFAFDHEAFNSYEVVDITAGIPLLVGNANNTIAVEVHQRGLNSTDMVMDLELTHSAQASLTRGPYLQNGAPYEMSIRWRTDLSTNSRVWYGNTLHALGQIADNPTVTTEHEVRLTGLTSHTRFYYAVGDTGGMITGDDDSTFFRTNPFPGDPYPTRIWAVGDAGWGSYSQLHARVAYEQYTGDRHTDLWLLLGDNAYVTGTDTEYQNGLFNMYRGMFRKSCVWSTRGNHDLIYGGPADDYYDFFTMPTAAEAGGLPSGSEAYYSFDFGNIHFICLDSEGTYLGTDGAMLSWLRQDVAATDKMWTICFWHHPPYSHGSHNSDNDGDSFNKMGNMRRNALPILDSTGVDVVLNGHSHSYERSFMLNGHYDPSWMLQSSNIVDGGTGRVDLDGPYIKPSLGSAPFEGALYVVAGSAGIASGGTLDHPVMVDSRNQLGTLVLDVQGTTLNGHFVDSTGTAVDSFTIVKGIPLDVAADAPGPNLSLALASENPSRHGVRLDYALPRPGHARISMFDLAGRRVARLIDDAQTAGRHQVAWTGRGSSGTRMASGVYVAVLEFGGERRATKVVLQR